MNEVELIDSLYKKLLDAGYPKDSIKLEYSVPNTNGKYTYIDVAIVEPTSGGVLAIYEVKSSKSGKIYREQIEQLASLAKLFPNAPQCFVYAKEGHEETLGVVNPNQLRVLFLDAPPTYDSLKLNNTTRKQLIKRQESRKVLDTFVVTCYVLAALMAIILVLDILEIYSFNAQQLGLLSVIGALVIAPHAAKVKVLGLEFERLKSSDDKNT
ncbi:hypothetical protein BWI06_RS23055 [Vibrio parahaemolyticus]|uniref:hypothetical protein n=1 Tax=Vibrio parahaemolyticus TaxID=670 RepID=UPI0004230F85|nr:hypothetical protein [Vibrio parahaemolyticus]EJE4561557.1 hypothetical protein [Vibrio parahaemolyticus]EJG1768165.1 hypothetical protein [Vibrio parahaemolyticus]EJO9912899.1 hypothetical protein [Vibrio parahaemolyticus]ELA7366408.1 hypothetical protein [Vibrio parahaemolyticus]MBE4053451.1 hypothetical protein [Vibrio parahaemolyticus]